MEVALGDMDGDMDVVVVGEGLGVALWLGVCVAVIDADEVVVGEGVWVTAKQSR